MDFFFGWPYSLFQRRNKKDNHGGEKTLPSLSPSSPPLPPPPPSSPPPILPRHTFPPLSTFLPSPPGSWLLPMTTMTTTMTTMVVKPHHILAILAQSPSLLPFLPLSLFPLLLRLLPLLLCPRLQPLLQLLPLSLLPLLRRLLPLVLILPLLLLPLPLLPLLLSPSPTLPLLLWPLLLRAPAAADHTSTSAQRHTPELSPSPRLLPRR